MANTDRPRGLEPKGRVREAREYVAGGVVYPGDAVAMADDGKVDAWASGAARGVALTHAAADGDKVLVCDDPDQKYVIQADDADIDAQTDIGLNYAIVVGTPDATYKRSAMELDSDSGATTATLALKLLAVEPRIDNELGAQVDCIVKINNHDLAGGTGTAGI